MIPMVIPVLKFLGSTIAYSLVGSYVENLFSKRQVEELDLSASVLKFGNGDWTFLSLHERSTSSDRSLCAILMSAKLVKGKRLYLTLMMGSNLRDRSLETLAHITEKASAASSFLNLNPKSWRRISSPNNDGYIFYMHRSLPGSEKSASYMNFVMKGGR